MIVLRAKRKSLGRHTSVTWAPRRVGARRRGERAKVAFESKMVVSGPRPGVSAVPYFRLSWVIEAASRRRNTLEKLVLNRTLWEGGNNETQRNYLYVGR
jgi:hypothetical protein